MVPWGCPVSFLCNCVPKGEIHVCAHWCWPSLPFSLLQPPQHREWIFNLGDPGQLEGSCQLCEGLAAE